MHTRTRRRSVIRLALAVFSVCLGAAACTPLEAQEAQRAPAAGPVPADLPMSPSAARGAKLYQNWCVGCHGPQGLGDGPATAFLDPLPRNLQAGRFKFRSTPSGELPTEDDLVRTITRGLKGSSMPAFPLLPESERRDLAQYVVHLAQFGRMKVEAQSLLDDGVPMDKIRAEKMGEIRDVLAGRIARAQPVGVPPETDADSASVARGKKIYTELCESCHGATGVGDGPSAYALRDGRDAPIRPRDFTVGVLRGGDTPQDIYRRLRTGLDGTPMPAFDSRGDKDLWDIVHVVMTLRRTGGGEQVR
ncbi:MAG: c-type cytochrome [Planctomycetes bacterium]|nr:c-type cytochrome [Planctomycetota bacterium]